MGTDQDLVRFYLRAQKDFFFFLEEVLGYKENPDFEYKKLTPTHKELAEFMMAPKHFKMVLMPRYSLKSGIVTIGYALWRIVNNPNIRILIYSDSSNKSEIFLGGIKDHLEGRAPNSKFTQYYPGWADPKNNLWSVHEIIIKKRTIGLREPTVDTAGIETSKIGLHQDLIIFDDIVSDLNTTTKYQMDKVHSCYQKALSLLRPGGDIVITGTRWHFGDTYGRIIDENIDKRNFNLFIRDAEQVDEKDNLIFEGIGLNREFLDQQRREQGSFTYSCLYRNNPVNDETAIFKVSNFKYYTYDEGKHTDLYITGTCDPAGEGEDFTAIVVCGMDDERNVYILDAINKHLKISEIINNIVRLQYKWRMDRFAVEKNFFKGLLEREFKTVVQEEGKNPEWKPLSFSENIVSTASTRTFTRVLALQPLVEQGKLFFPGKNINTLPKAVGELAYQMSQFTMDGAKSPHDDLLIALSFQVEIMRPGGRSTLKDGGPPTTSAAWYEKKVMEELGARNSRVPSRFRRNIQMAFN